MIIETVFAFLITQIILSKLITEPILEQRKIINEIEFALRSTRLFYEDVYHKGYLGNFEIDFRTLSKDLFLLSIKIKNTLNTFLYYDIFYWLGIVVSKESLYEASFDLEIISEMIDTRFRDKLSEEQIEYNKEEFDRRFVDVMEKLKINKWEMVSVLPRRWGFWGNYPYEFRYRKLFKR